MGSDDNEAQQCGAGFDRDGMGLGGDGVGRGNQVWRDIARDGIGQRDSWCINVALSRADSVLCYWTVCWIPVRLS